MLFPLLETKGMPRQDAYEHLHAKVHTLLAELAQHA